MRNVPLIYGLKDPRHGMFCYVGQAVDAAGRYQRHMASLRYDGNYSKLLWMEDMKKAGVEPEMVILQECETFEEVDPAEREWIRRLIEEDHPILNMAGGGLGSRRGSKMAAARKRDWIELGYTVKCAREATLKSMCRLSGMIPKTSKEVRLLDKALKAIDQACHLLDEQVCEEYPSWKEFLQVFYSPAAEHAAAHGEEYRKLDRETRQRTMTQRDIQQLMKEYPDLNDEGMGVFSERDLTPEQRSTKLREGQKLLLESVEACNKVCSWLSDVDCTERIDERIGSSYNLKQIAEKDIGYVSNGVFIAASLFCGFPCRIELGSLNVWFGMSRRSIRSIEMRLAKTDQAVH